MIEILSYEPPIKNKDKSKVIGYVDIKISNEKLSMIVRRISHLQSGDKRWFNLPAFSKPKADGSLQFMRFWEFEFDAYNGGILKSLEEPVKKFCLKNNIEIGATTAPLEKTEEELPF